MYDHMEITQNPNIFQIYYTPNMKYPSILFYKFAKRVQIFGIQFSATQPLDV